MNIQTTKVICKCGRIHDFSMYKYVETNCKCGARIRYLENKYCDYVYRY